MGKSVCDTGLCHTENGDLYSGLWTLARETLPDFRQEEI